jgi:hypothetical protein
MNKHKAASSPVQGATGVHEPAKGGIDGSFGSKIEGDVRETIVGSGVNDDDDNGSAPAQLLWVRPKM